MAEQLNPEQIADYKRLLENEKKQKEIDHYKDVGCMTVGAVGLASGAVIGGVVGAVGGAAGGCATGTGVVDMYYRSGVDTAIETAKSSIEGIKEYGNRMLKELEGNGISPSPSLPINVRPNSPNR